MFAFIGGIFGAILGTIIFPVAGTVAGILIGTFLGASSGEYIVCRDWNHSFCAGLGALKGRVISIFVKLFITFVISFSAIIDLINTK